MLKALRPAFATPFRGFVIVTLTESVRECQHVRCIVVEVFIAPNTFSAGRFADLSARIHQVHHDGALINEVGRILVEQDALTRDVAEKVVVVIDIVLGRKMASGAVINPRRMARRAVHVVRVREVRSYEIWVLLLRPYTRVVVSIHDPLAYDAFDCKWGLR